MWWKATSLRTMLENRADAEMGCAKSVQGRIAIPAQWIGTCCGDGVCGDLEDCSSCSEDCGTCAVCGDGECTGDETIETCPDDCTLETSCGDGVCSDDDGENCLTCTEDCLTPDNPCLLFCGDGTCSDGEDCSVCSPDCGECETCGDGECIGEETCETCSDDCGPCTTCGNGVCDEGENCDTCVTDCGECETCGDGVCSADDGEDCSTCTDDCGTCECIDFHAQEASEEASYEEEVKSPKILGTGVEASMSGSIGASASIGPEGCSLGSSAEGAIEACGKILYNGVCVNGEVNLSLECSMDLVCNNPPIFECDPNTMCCTAELGGSLMVSRTWGVDKEFGRPLVSSTSKPASAGRGISQRRRTGMRCGPHVSAQADLTGSGGGGCEVGLWGLSMGAKGDLTAGACGGRVFTSGCGGGGNWISGAYVKVTIGPVDFGWFGSWDYSKKWKVGDDC